MKLRRGALLLSAAVLGATLFAAVRELPPAGHYAGPYGDVINAVGTSERRATDVVASINFDYRGFDTLGEEFILFASVIGATVLLRKQEDESDDDDDSDSESNDCESDRDVPHTSEAIRGLALGLVGATVCFGLYVTSHGQLSPGGGFQGGVILATAPLVVYLAATVHDFQRIAPEWLIHATEAAGAAGYVGIGIAGLLSAKAFLANVVPLGKVGDIWSSGTIWLLNLSVGIEVAAGFVLLLATFVAEALQRRLERDR